MSGEQYAFREVAAVTDSRYRDVRWIFVALFAAMALAATGCGGDDDSEERPAVSAVGRVQESNAFVWVASTNLGIEAYVCDGKNGIGESFVGEPSGDTLETNSVSGDAQIEVTVTEDGASGTFTAANGRSYDFEASELRDKAAFYVANLQGKRHYAALIFLPNGEQRGSIRQTNNVLPAPQLNPASGTVNIGGQSSVVQIQHFRVDNIIG
jgi:hypothetical protein